MEGGSDGHACGMAVAMRKGGWTGYEVIDRALVFFLSSAQRDAGHG